MYIYICNRERNNEKKRKTKYYQIFLIQFFINVFQIDLAFVCER